MSHSVVSSPRRGMPYRALPETSGELAPCAMASGRYVSRRLLRSGAIRMRSVYCATAKVGRRQVGVDECGSRRHHRPRSGRLHSVAFVFRIGEIVHEMSILLSSKPIHHGGTENTEKTLHKTLRALRVSVVQTSFRDCAMWMAAPPRPASGDQSGALHAAPTGIHRNLPLRVSHCGTTDRLSPCSARSWRLSPLRRRTSPPPSARPASSACPTGRPADWGW